MCIRDRGWSGGAFGDGSRISLSFTRAIIDAIHNGTLSIADYAKDKHFGLAIPKACPGVPGKILRPKGTWKDPADYVAMANKLTAAFQENFAKYSDKASQAVIDAGPA